MNSAVKVTPKHLESQVILVLSFRHLQHLCQPRPTICIPHSCGSLRALRPADGGIEGRAPPQKENSPLTVTSGGGGGGPSTRSAEDRGPRSGRFDSPCESPEGVFRRSPSDLREKGRRR
jgi:hypothetical protein